MQVGSGIHAAEHGGLFFSASESRRIQKRQRHLYDNLPGNIHNGYPDTISKASFEYGVSFPGRFGVDAPA
jgi:hypothetical protein